MGRIGEEIDDDLLDGAIDASPPESALSSDTERAVTLFFRDPFQRPMPGKRDPMRDVMPDRAASADPRRMFLRSCVGERSVSLRKPKSYSVSNSLGADRSSIFGAERCTQKGSSPGQS